MKVPLLFLFLYFLSFLCNVECRGVWGSKRKRQTEEEDNPVADILSQSFEMKRKQATAKLLQKNKSPVSEAMSKFKELFDSYIRLVDEFLSSSQFESFMNPEVLQTIFQQIPGLSENQQYAEMLQSLLSMDQEQLHATARMGIQTMKQYVDNLSSIADDPVQLTDALSQFPEDLRSILEALIHGDVQPLKEKFINEPSLDSSVKRIIISLIDGKIEEVIAGAKEYMKDNPSIIENARKQFLKNSEMADLMGLPSDILKDKRKWMEAVENGLDVLGNVNGQFDEVEVEANGFNRNKFATAAE
jgi:hypothetical protein